MRLLLIWQSFVTAIMLPGGAGHLRIQHIGDLSRTDTILAVHLNSTDLIAIPRHINTTVMGVNVFKIGC